MSRTKHTVTIAVEQSLKDVLIALGVPSDPFTTRTQHRESSKSFRECRVENDTVFEAYHDPVVAANIGAYIKATCPNCIGVYPKAFIPDNRVRRSNNTRKAGLMIHFKV